MPRTTIGPDSPWRVGCLPAAVAPGLSGTRPSVHRLNVELSAADERSCCCGATVMSCAARWPMPAPGSPASRPSSPTAPAPTPAPAADPRAFCGDADAVLRTPRAPSSPPRWRSSTSTASARSTPAAAPRPATPRCGRRRAPARPHARVRRPRAHRRRRARRPHARHAVRGARICCERLIAQLEGADIPAPASSPSRPASPPHRSGTTIERLLAAAGRRLDRARADGGARAAARPAERRRRTPSAPRRTSSRRWPPRCSSATATPASTPRSSSTWPGPSPARSASTRSRSSASATPPCCTTSARSAMPDRILHKPGPLTARSGTLMREHPVIGERILRAIPGMGSVARIVRHEHERFDGCGLPRRPRRRGDPVGSRIILACDAYHAMTSDRPYRAAMPRPRGRRARALRGHAVRPADHRGARGPPRRGDGEPRFATPPR